MIIMGVDFHPEFQQIALVDTDSGEFQERRLQHGEEAERFYRELAAHGVPVRVGREASGHARWFERLLAELGFELWIGDAAEIRSKRVRKQKTDRQDAQLILQVRLEDGCPRIWVAAGENRDLRQLLWHRQRMGASAHRFGHALPAISHPPFRYSPIFLTYSATRGSSHRPSGLPCAAAVRIVVADTFCCTPSSRCRVTPGSTRSPVAACL